MGEKFAWPLQIGLATVAVAVVWIFVGAAAIPLAGALCAFGVFEAYMDHQARKRAVIQTAAVFVRTGLLEGKTATVIHDSGKVTLCVVDPDADPDDEGLNYMTDSEGY